MPLNNFGRVDARVYRAAQPDHRGLLLLRDALEVHAVFKLNTDEESTDPELDGVVVHHTAIHGIEAPSDDWTRRLVEEIRQQAAVGAVLVHCTYGRDRTGFVVAAYELLALGRELGEVLATRAAYGVEGEWHELLNQSFTRALHRLAASRDGGAGVN